MKHKHHIIPKHMGGSDNADNIVELTVEEHAEAHKKLYEQHGHWQDYCAWQALSGRIGQEEILRMKQGANKGKKPSPETIERMRQSALIRAERQRADGTLARANKKRSETQTGYKKSAEHIKNWSASRKGYKQTEETKAKIRKARAKQKNVRGVIQDV